MRRFRRRATLLWALVLTAALVWGGVHWALQRQLPGRVLGQQLSRALGFPVRYSGYHLSWDAELQLHDLELLDAKGLPILRVGRAALDFDRSRALTGQLLLEGITLENARLELSSSRLEQLRSRPARPTSGSRRFPVLLRNLDLAWLDREGQTRWSSSGWQGSLPPEDSQGWSLALQDHQQAVLEARAGQVRLRNFPLSLLAAIFNGTGEPFAASDRADLEARRGEQGWQIQGELRSSVYSGQAAARQDSAGWVLSGSQAQLPVLGRVESWETRLQDGQLDGQARLWARTVRFKGRPGQLQLSQEPWRAQLEWHAEELRLRWQRKTWTGSLRRQGQSWNVEPGPLRLDELSPDWKGVVTSRWWRDERRRWRGWLQASQLTGPGTKIRKLHLKLADSWNGGAEWNGERVTVKGSPMTPELRLTLPGLRLPLTAVADLPAQLVRIRPGKHALSLPQLEGELRVSAEGPSAHGLQLRFPGGLVTPVEAGGRWNEGSWHLQSRLAGLQLRSLSPAFTGELQAQMRLDRSGPNLSAQARDLRWKGEKLGDWKLIWRAGRLQLQAPALSVGGVQLAASRVEAEVLKDRLRVREAQLGKGKSALSLAGDVLRNPPALRLSGRVAQLDLAALPWTPGGLSGRLSGAWKINGPLSAPRATFQGKVVNGFPLREFPLQASWHGGKGKLQLGPFALQHCSPLRTRLPQLQGTGRLGAEFPGPRLQLSLADLKVGGHALPPLEARGRWQKGAVMDCLVLWKLSPQPLKLAGNLGLLSGLRGELQGQSLQDLTLGLVAVTGQAFGKVSCTLAQGLQFDGEVRGLVVGGHKLGTGQLHVSSAKGGQVSGQGFPAAEMEVLQQRYPGLSGRLGFDFTLAGKRAGSVNLREAHWQGRPFPQVDCTLAAEGERWRIASLQVATEPALQASGWAHAAAGELEISGSLQGHSLADLTWLAGGAAGGEISTRLYGPFRLHTQAGQTRLQFSGSARELRYRGVDLGEGKLELVASPELRGELLLAQPVAVEQVAGGLGSLLPGGLLKVVRIRGVKLSGRLERPSVSPIWDF